MTDPAIPRQDIARWSSSSPGCSGGVCGGQLWTIGFDAPPGSRGSTGIGFYALKVGIPWSWWSLDDQRHYVEVTGTADELRRFIRWAENYESHLRLGERFKDAPFMASRELS
jgi:hypothetical protein